MTCIRCRKSVVYELEQPPRSGDETRHAAPRMDVFQTIGNGAAFDEMDSAVGKHFGMDSQVVLVP